MGIAMMRPTTPIAALTVVTAVDHASTMNSVPSVNATLEILVSATVGLFAKMFSGQFEKPNCNQVLQMLKVFFYLVDHYLDNPKFTMGVVKIGSG